MEVTCHDTTKTAINANGKQAWDSTDTPTEVCKEKSRKKSNAHYTTDENEENNN